MAVQSGGKKKAAAKKKATSKKAAAKKTAAKKTASKKKAGASRTRRDAQTERTQRAREKFLTEFRKRANVRDAAEAAGVGRSTVYQWYEADSEFARQWDEAEGEAIDRLEAEAWRRGVEGIPKPVSYQGEIKDYYTEYSDRMLELMLRARRPERYSEKHQVEHSGGINVNLGFDLSAGDE